MDETVPKPRRSSANNEDKCEGIRFFLHEVCATTVPLGVGRCGVLTGRFCRRQRPLVCSERHNYVATVIFPQQKVIFWIMKT